MSTISLSDKVERANLIKITPWAVEEKPQVFKKITKKLKTLPLQSAGKVASLSNCWWIIFSIIFMNKYNQRICLACIQSIKYDEMNTHIPTMQLKAQSIFCPVRAPCAFS